MPMSLNLSSAYLAEHWASSKTRRRKNWPHAEA